MVNEPWEMMYSKDLDTMKRMVKSAKLIKENLKLGDVLVDVGCYTTYLKTLIPLGVRYVGVDVKHYVPVDMELDMDRQEDRMLLVETIRARFSGRNIHVSLLETLEHLRDPEEVIKCITMMNPSYITISLPNEATIFHRIRALFGTVDAEALNGPYKHMHLPNMKQSISLISKYMSIVKMETYITPNAYGTRNKYMRFILRLIPEKIQEWMARVNPSLFARGFIFLAIPKSF